MRIHVASDLHLDSLQTTFERSAFLEAAPQADALVLAGDIHRGTGAIETFANWPVPVVYVSGNHEAYGGVYENVVAALDARASGTQVNYLERRSLVLDGVRFLGCCLWTDYALYGDPASSLEYARDAMTDHASISHEGGNAFTPEAALAEHRRAVAWLADELARPFDGKTVVVTHHGISPESIHERFAGHPINPGFVSDLRHLLPLANLWIHGHVHDSFDYQSCQSRVVANPRGYPLNLSSAKVEAEIEWENKLFDPALVIEI
jgi:hypothetical protein